MAVIFPLLSRAFVSYWVYQVGFFGPSFLEVYERFFPLGSFGIVVVRDDLGCGVLASKIGDGVYGAFVVQCLAQRFAGACFGAVAGVSARGWAGKALAIEFG